LKQITNTLKALSDEIRLRIINILYDQELCVCEIVDALSLPQSTVSRHLTVLKNANIVEDIKHGQWAFYKLLKGKEDDSFIENLIKSELRANSEFQKDIESLKKRLEKGRGCLIKN